MLRYEYLACIEIHKRLQEYVTGRIFTTIQDDTLKVFIKGFRGIGYSYEIKHIHLEMLGYELNYEKIVRIIVREYKSFIMDRFFRR